MNHMNRVLVVDDEPNMLHMLSTVLSEHGYQVACAETGADALERVKSERFDFILSDVRMPGMTGLQLLDHLQKLGVDAIVILMSAYGNVDSALEAIRKGAYDYIAKPFKTDEVTLTFRKAAERERLRKEVIRLKRKLDRYEDTAGIVAKSSSMRQILGFVRQFAPFDSPVLITGESGTGKEVTAGEIHRLSKRVDGPFVPVNCGAIPKDLLEAELFGYAKGSFTGAESDRLGLFEEADSGTLFLDEIAALAPPLQGKLLRALAESEIRRIGETRARKVSVRIVAATNEDLEKGMAAGTFRTDLFYRLHVAAIHIPPLRERREDIMPLVEHFTANFNRKLGLKIRGIDREARECLLNWQWKGNVRELQNVIERAMILSTGPVIGIELLPKEMYADDRRTEGVLPDESPDSLSLRKGYREVDRVLINRALKKTNGNRSQAAALLEISYPSLLQKIKTLGITPVSD